MAQRPLAAVVVAVALAACGRGSHLPAADPAATQGGPVRVFVSEYAFGLTVDTLQAGWHRFLVINFGKEMHMAVIARLDSGKTYRDVIAGVRAKIPMPWMTEVGGVNAVMPGDSLSAAVSLTDGYYVLVCYVTDPGGKYHLFDGMIAPLVVAPGGVAAIAEPVADDTVSLTSYRIGFTTPPTAGTHVFRVGDDDAGNVAHDLVIVRLNEGKTPQDVTAWIGSLKGPAPFTVVAATTGMAKGLHDYLYATMAPGKYLALCLMSAPDGKRHFVHGMEKAFTVGS